MLSACLPFKYRQTTDKETFKIFVWWMKWESYISYFYTIKLDWENEHKRGRVVIERRRIPYFTINDVLIILW